MDPKDIKLYDFDDNHDRNKTVIWKKFGKLLERRAYYGVGLIYDVTKYAKWCTKASDIRSGLDQETRSGEVLKDTERPERPERPETRSGELRPDAKKPERPNSKLRNYEPVIERP